MQTARMPLAQALGSHGGGWRSGRSETLGKRRIELAEDVLTDFYEARDIINEACLAGSISHEGTTRPKGVAETEEDNRILNAYFAVAERLNKKNEFFARLESRRYRFIAIFGMAAAKPYHELRDIHGEILIAVR